MVIVIFIPVYWLMEPGRQEAARIRQQAEAVERGAKTYSSACASCHGAQGEGIIGPALKGISLDDNVLAKIIARGIPGTVMSAWGVEDEGPLKTHQINDLVTFIKNWDSATPVTMKQPPQTTVPTTAANPTPPPQAMPSTIDGREIFSNSCSACHGQNREGTSGFAPALTPDSLAALTDDQISDTIANGRPGTAMPPFKDMINPDKIDALLQFIKYTP